MSNLFRPRALTPRERKLAYGLAVTLIFYTVYQFFVGTLLYNSQINQQDFVCYYAAAKALSLNQPIYNSSPWPLNQTNVLAEIPVIDGENPRSHLYYLYPPLLAWCLQPLLWMPYTYAEWVWNILLVLTYWIGVLVFAHFFRNHIGCTRKESIAFVVLAAYWAPMFLAIRMGQITPIVFCLIAIHIVLSLRHKEILAGIALALATTFKIYPLFLLSVWLFSRRWKIVLSTLITILLLIILTDWQQNVHFFTVIFPHVTMGEVHPINHTFAGVYLRQVLDTWGWLTPEQYEKIYIGHTVMRLLLILGWGVSLWGIWRKSNEHLLRLNIALVLVAIPVFSTLARIHYFMYLLISLFIYYLELRRRTNKVGWFVLSYTTIVLLINLSEWLYPLSWNALTEDIFTKPVIPAAFLLWVMILIRQKRLLYQKVETAKI